MSGYSHHYRHFGVQLAANVELAALAPAAAGPPDLTVQLEHAGALPTLDDSWQMVDPPRPTWRQDTEAGSRLRLRFMGADQTWAEFVLDERGTTMQILLAAGASVAEASELLAGNVFSCLLAQRGWSCLHASVAAIKDRAVAFVGPKGAGKSTLVSHLARSGTSVLSDDVAAIRPVGAAWEVAVGRSLTRLLADSAASAGIHFDTLEPVWDDALTRPRKRFFDAGPFAKPDSVELGAIVMLAPRQEDARVKITRLDPQQALPRLIANRHLAATLDPGRHRRDFIRLGSLVAELPVYELQRPDDLAQLPIAVKTVIRAMVAELQQT
jgi:hypothetical protein